MTLQHYKNSPAMGRRYAELNGITHCEYDRNMDGQPCAWEMNANLDAGFPTPFRTVREAKTAVAEGNALLAAWNAQ